MGVDIEDLGSPCHSEFRNIAGRRRVAVHLPDDIIRDYGGGFIGLLRPALYERLLTALPPGVLQVEWSKGRTTLAGDAAHPTSPYAAYGAGMAIEDGYFIGRHLAGVDLRDHQAVRQALHAYENPRKPHTARQSQQAYILGKVFQHAPRPLRILRDAILDHTPLLQKAVGESSPAEIIKQITEIDIAERAFKTAHGNTTD